MNDYARDHCIVGEEIIDLILNSIQKLTNQCAGIQSFLISHPFGDETSTGFEYLLLECLLVD